MVEDLRVGDLVETMDHGVQPLRWVGKRTLSFADLIVQPKLRPVQIAAGALGAGLPERTMMVSQQHRTLVEGVRAVMLFGAAQVLVTATHLTSPPDVKPALPYGVTYRHLLFDQHERIKGDGTWTESFQPADRMRDAIEAAQRAGIETLFPDKSCGVGSLPAVRPTLKAYEERVLMAV